MADCSNSSSVMLAGTSSFWYPSGGGCSPTRGTPCCNKFTTSISQNSKCLRSCSKKRMFFVLNAAAMVVEVMRESADMLGPNLKWLGKAFDLSKAYKQLAVLPAHQRHAVVGFPVKGVWRFYKSISLPFGCTGSVHMVLLGYHRRYGSSLANSFIASHHITSMTFQHLRDRRVAEC